ncbi:MAG: AAA family ATPase [Gammaproteobacteria bacterium]|jgi:chromosome partitioning protein|nr:AAA family ATPase [Gammaproteobacteria bacterium]MBT5222272.1 AAA family ATPase [Gammaproteobacteria bacterium]MBT5825170.1 AAA family ATPase [Gammaproteobacteria bacterium]MBT5967101.1 AAA family ATPase [Gammaproteobacteria bacterium]MBT6421193.1 AAA family ATPase [Gammaproteobacteria bacterium]
MKIIASYNIKGGVGKTSTSVNLAYIAAQQDYKTLVWDLDPQGASSYYFRVKPKVKGGSKQLIAGDRNLDGLIKATDFNNLDLLPADFSFRNLDLVLDERKKPTQRLKKLLSPLTEEYDLIILDCPPNISLLSESIFAASDILLSPIIPTTLSLRTLEQLKKYIKDNKLKHLQLVPFFSMADRRKKMHREIIDTLSEKHPDILQTAIPYASDIERMGLERKPLGAYLKKGRSTVAYQLLWQELLARMNNHET